MKTCLVGCGGIAAVHGSVLTSGIDTEFVAAADIKPEKAQTYAENFHTKPYPSLESMLDAEKPDVLHICTPHYLSLIHICIDRGINFVIATYDSKNKSGFVSGKACLLYTSRCV